MSDFFEDRPCSSGRAANGIHPIRNARIGSSVPLEWLEQAPASAFVIIALAYSARRESIRFTFARRDGTTLATTVTSAGGAAAPARATGSHGFRRISSRPPQSVLNTFLWDKHMNSQSSTVLND